jgi:hypothetical protein
MLKVVGRIGWREVLWWQARAAKPGSALAFFFQTFGHKGSELLTNTIVIYMTSPQLKI